MLHCSDLSYDVTRTMLMCLSVSRLQRRPHTLPDLIASLKLLETLQGSMTKTETQIPMIHNKFALLDKYEVALDQNVRTWSNHRLSSCPKPSTLSRLTANWHLMHWLSGAQSAREPKRGVGVVPGGGVRL